MSRGKETNLKDALSNYLEGGRLRNQYNQARLRTEWESLVGKPIADRTRGIFIRNDELILTVDSAALRTEMLQLKDKVLELVNGFLGEGTIKSVDVK